MADVIIPPGHGIAKYIWTMTGKSNPMTSTMGYAAVLTPPEDCAEAMSGYAEVAGSICDTELMASIITYVGVEVIQNVEGEMVGAAWSVGSTGESLAALPPVNTSLLISKRTTAVGRWARGRMYLPNLGTTEGDIDPMGNLNPAAFLAFSDAVGVFASEGIGAGAPFFALLHSEIGRPPTTITSLAPKQKVATQRRRLRS